MNQAHLVEMFKAWEVIDDAEKLLGELLHGEGASQADLQDLLGSLIDCNVALSAVLGELLGGPVEGVRDEILSRQRAMIAEGA